MSRARLVAVLAVALAGAGSAAADGARDAISDQLRGELDVLERTLATVGDKLDTADAQRVRRVRAAYRILHAPVAVDASAGDRMASARRRAAARLLLERDRAERDLLAAEAAQLRAAMDERRAASARVPSLALPTELARPADGSIVRRFGTLIHERSKARLSRRGLDFEVAPHAPAYAPADGVVRYAGAIRGLDHGVILDHGDCYTVLGKLAEPAIPAGARVARGDRIGRAARARVYLEVRVKLGPGGIPIDPEPLLASRAP